MSLDQKPEPLYPELLTEVKNIIKLQDGAESPEVVVANYAQILYDGLFEQILGQMENCFISPDNLQQLLHGEFEDIRGLKVFDSQGQDPKCSYTIDCCLHQPIDSDKLVPVINIYQQEVVESHTFLLTLGILPILRAKSLGLNDSTRIIYNLGGINMNMDQPKRQHANNIKTESAVAILYNTFGFKNLRTIYFFSPQKEISYNALQSIINGLRTRFWTKNTSSVREDISLPYNPNLTTIDQLKQLALQTEHIQDRNFRCYETFFKDV